MMLQLEQSKLNKMRQKVKAVNKKWKLFINKCITRKRDQKIRPC